MLPSAAQAHQLLHAHGIAPQPPPQPQPPAGARPRPQQPSSSLTCMLVEVGGSGSGSSRPARPPYHPSSSMPPPTLHPPAHPRASHAAPQPALLHAHAPPAAAAYAAPQPLQHGGQYGPAGAQWAASPAAQHASGSAYAPTPMPPVRPAFSSEVHPATLFSGHAPAAAAYGLGSEASSVQGDVGGWGGPAGHQYSDGVMPTPPARSHAQSHAVPPHAAAPGALPQGQWAAAGQQPYSAGGAGGGGGGGMLPLHTLKAITAYLHRPPRTNIGLGTPAPPPPPPSAGAAGYAPLQAVPPHTQYAPVQPQYLQPQQGYAHPAQQQLVQQYGYAPQQPLQGYWLQPGWVQQPQPLHTQQQAQQLRQQQQVHWRVVEQQRQEQAARSASAIALLLAPDSGLQDRLARPLTAEEAHELQHLQRLAHSAQVNEGWDLGPRGRAPLQHCCTHLHTRSSWSIPLRSHASLSTHRLPRA